MPKSEVHLTEETVPIDVPDERNNEDMYNQGFVPRKSYGYERIRKAGKFLLTMKYVKGVSQVHISNLGLTALKKQSTQWEIFCGGYQSFSLVLIIERLYHESQCTPPAQLMEYGSESRGRRVRDRCKTG